jgi:hypothetical protein
MPDRDFPRLFTRAGASYDVTAAIQPGYGERHNDPPAGLIGFLWSRQNPYLLPVFEDVCPQPDVRRLLPASDALRAWSKGSRLLTIPPSLSRIRSIRRMEQAVPCF